MTNMFANFVSHVRIINRGLVVLALSLISTLGYAQSHDPLRQAVMAQPQSFEPNRGQAPDGVDFISHGPGYTLSLAPQEADLQLVAPESLHRQGKNTTVRMKWLGANKCSSAEGSELQTGRSNYLIGNNPSAWRTDLPHFGRVRYNDVYPGIGVVYYGNHQQLEYDFVLSPNADPHRILLAVDGADRIRVDENGDLVLTEGSVEIRQRKPIVYQDTASGRTSIEGRYVIRGRNRIGFAVSRYDRRKPLIIDPILVFSTYFGGNGDDKGLSLRLDAAGNIYICGTTGSTNFPGTPMPGTPSGQPLNGTGTAAFAAKISSSGILIYSTYVGGTNDQAFGAGLAVDSNGNAYLVGNTGAADFPTVNPIQAALKGNHDAFILELNTSGSGLVYSTYLGGSQLDYAERVEVDSNANAYVVGSTESADFPTVNAEQSTFGGSVDAFAAKISTGGSSLIYSTYIGGSGVDFSNGLAIDSSGDLFVFGDTGSTNFPVLNAFQSVSGGGTDGWLAELSPTGSLLHSTYIGGSGGDAVRGGKVDSSGNIYLTGNTTSTNFPTLNAIQPNYGGGNNDAWVAKLNLSGSSLVYSTYLGGSSDDGASDIAFDASGNVYVVGYTSSTNFPTANAIQKTLAGGTNAFLTKINSTGSAIVFSTFLGGNGTDRASQLAVDAADRAYLVGSTSSTNFPTVNPLLGTFAGGPEDVFVSVIATCDFTLTPPSGTFASTGGSGNVAITTTPECGWTATSNNPWITITSNASGEGSGSISYSVAPNTQGTQNGSITIGTQTFSIVEFGNSVTLTSINPTSGAQGANVPVTLTGTNFAANSTVNVSGNGVTVGNVQVVSATQITATFGIAANATLGGYTVSVTSSGMNSNGATFTVTSAMVPVLSSLSPASGGAGNSVPVMLTGANFIAGATLSSTNSALSFSNVNVVSGTQITATFTLASNASPGSAPVTVTTSYGSSNAVGFTIQPLFTPIRVDAGSKQPYTDALGQVWSADSGFTGGGLFAVNHAISGTPAPTLYQTLHYSNSTLSYQATVPNGQYTVNLKFEENQFNQAGKRLFNVLLNGQQVLTNFDEFAAAGAQYQAVDVPLPVTVTNGAINLQFVSVLNPTGVYAIEIVAGTPPAPTISSITPSTGTIGTAVPVTIVGTNLASDVVINAGPNITVSNVVVVSATQVTATFNIVATAAPGQANVTVTTPGGSTSPSPFTISGGPALTSISPTSGVQGANVPVTLTGANFAANAAVNVSGSGVSVNNVQVVSATQITATFGIAANATLGGDTVTVTSSGVTTNGVTFTVTAPPSLISISPASAAQGANVPVTLTGTNFAPNSTVNMSDSGVTVSGVKVVSATQITATFGITANATLGADTVTVTSSGVTTNGVAFTVTAAPTLTSISPTTGVQGTNVPVTLTGTNFAGTATVNVSGSGVTVSNVQVVSATQITANFGIAANAVVGGDTVTVTSSGVTTNGVTFTVTAAPTLTSISPASGAQGANVPVTLTGTNFAANSTVNVSGSGVTVSNVQVVSATQITATFGIAANATLGGYTVSVTSSGMNSNGAMFTVTSAMVPVLNSLSPASGGAGNSVPVTLIGANFIAGATLSSTNSALSFSNVNVVSGTQITATFTLASNASPGSAPVTVTTSYGNSNAVGFTIQPLFTPIRVDAGSKQPYTDALGQVWSADSGFTGGGLFAVNHAISGTPAPTLYQTLHYSNSTLSYQATVPNGQYTVNLKFEENQFNQAGKRLFNVLLNGQQVLTNFDEFAAAGAQYQAVDVPLPVTVTNGAINLQFVPVLNPTGVYAIEIVAGTPPAPTISSITPSTGTIGTAVPVTIVGTNLASDVVINAGSNITVSNVVVVSATQVTATFNIATTAAPGQANVTVTTPGGSTSPSPFTITH